MKPDSIVMVYRTGNDCPPSTANAAAPIMTLDRRVKTNSRRSNSPTTHRRGLLGLHESLREGEFWEGLIFGALGMCGAAGTILALVRIVAAH